MKVTENGNIKHRQLTLWDYLPKDTAEREEITEVCAPSKITETDITNTNKQADGLLEEILADKNLYQAYKRVKRNKGAGGIDGMQVDELLPFLREHKDELDRKSVV